VPPLPDLLESARALAVDGWTAEVARALADAGVDALLLKGPAIVWWLYDRGEERGYLDVDMLVAPATIPDAERVLTQLGFVLKDPEGEALRTVSGPHARTWWRASDRAIVDLHHTLPGDVDAEDVVWPVLWRRSETLTIAGAEVRILDEPSRALLVAIHAAHHGPGVKTPLEDLRRAATRVPDEVWEDAAGLAAAVMGLSQFSEGLALVPEAALVAERINVPSAEVLEMLERERLASGFERLAKTRGARARAALLRREAFPPVEFMQWWAPWSRGGRWRLGPAYAYRLGYLAAHAGPGWRAWRRGRAGARP
jgi:hypothetical protein